MTRGVTSWKVEFINKGMRMCGLCGADGNYFHTPECMNDQLVQVYPVMWLRDSPRLAFRSLLESTASA